MCLNTTETKRNVGPINPSALLVTVPRMDVLQKWFSLWLAMGVITKTCPCNLLQFITAVKKMICILKIVMFFS